MVFPPGDITLLDNFDRADGAVYAGAGSTLWDTIRRDGGASDLVVSSSVLASSNVGEGGGATTETVTDFIRIVKIAANGGGLGFYFGFRLANLGASFDGYLWVLAPGTWTLYRMAAGVFTALGSASAFAPDPGAYIAFRSVGNVHEVWANNYAGQILSWPSTPQVSVTDTSSTYTSGRVTLEVGNPGWRYAEYLSASLTAPTTPVTIYVDPDHAATSDTYNRTQASSASTPLRTLQQAGWLARAGTTWADTILVKPSTDPGTDLGVAHDPNMQAATDYRYINRGAFAASPGWPLGDNSGNPPIVVQGDVATPFVDMPKVHSWHSRGLKNWTVQDIQFGYDVSDEAARAAGTGWDYRTSSTFERVADFTLRRCLFTGGLGFADHWAGEFNVDQCVVHSPLPPDGGSPAFHDGAGLRIAANAPSDSEGTSESAGVLNITGNEFSYVRGDDALTISGVDDAGPFWAVMQVYITGNQFVDVTEGGPGGNPAFHCDSTQILQVPFTHVSGNFYLGCSDSFLATDFHNGRIEYENNIVVGDGSQVQIQGTDEVSIRHNTFFATSSFGADASVMFFIRDAIAQPTLATIVDNVLGGFYMRDNTGTVAQRLEAYFRTGSVISNNAIVYQPGLTSTFGTNIAGIPEFGHDPRLDVLPNVSLVFGALARTWGLANSPSPSPGVGDGVSTSIVTDFFGRSYATPPDAGALQSSAGTPVTPIARPPYVIAQSPAAGATGISPSTDVTATLYPVPGQTINAATVTTATVKLIDPAGNVLPATVSLNAGTGVITLDVDGDLYPYVVYTVQLASTIADTAGSQLGALMAWTFRVFGSGAAVYPVGGAPPVAAGWLVSGF
jgi:hypothetical protein